MRQHRRAIVAVGRCNLPSHCAVAANHVRGRITSDYLPAKPTLILPSAHRRSTGDGRTTLGASAYYDENIAYRVALKYRSLATRIIQQALVVIAAGGGYYRFSGSFAINVSFRPEA